MPKPIKVRSSYFKDITYLSRLAESVEMDENQDRQWQETAKALIKNLIDHLYAAQKPTK